MGGARTVTDELKPCPAPWCQSTEEVSVEGYRGMEFVCCGGCGCTGPEGNNPAELVALWNTRAEADTLASQARQIEALRWALLDNASSLAAAISLLEKGGKQAKKAAPSDRMFDQMLKDYRASLAHARATLEETSRG